MVNYKVLKSAGKVSVKKQDAADAVHNDDGSLKTSAVKEELQVVCKRYDYATGESLDDVVKAFGLAEVSLEINRLKADISKLQSQQADWEELEKDLKAL